MLGFTTITAPTDGRTGIRMVDEGNYVRSADTNSSIVVITQLQPISVELTYGLERICMFLNDIRNIFDIPWNESVTYGQVRRDEEVDMSHFCFKDADPALVRSQFEGWEGESARLLAKEDAPNVWGAYEAALKCSHLFNILDARGAISVTERAAFIARIRKLAVRCADAWLKRREAAEFPLLPRETVVRT
jgi:glycyl-tRNA synthetase alpha chain